MLLPTWGDAFHGPILGSVPWVCNVSHTHTNTPLLRVTVWSRGGQGRSFLPAADLFLHMTCACINITIPASLPAPHSWCWVYTDSSKEEGEEAPEPGKHSPPPPPPSQKHHCSHQSGLYLDALTLAQAASAWRPCWANSNSVSGSPRAWRDDLDLPTAISPWISVLFCFPICLNLSSYFSVSPEIGWERRELFTGPLSCNNYLFNHQCSTLSSVSIASSFSVCPWVPGVCWMPDPNTG